MNIEEKFWSRVDRSEGCWRWLGSISRGGFGVHWWKGTYRQAHRLACELSGVPLTAHAPLFQACGNRLCVNPEHLRAPADLAEARFWAKVHRRSTSECWNWTGYVSRDGYGSFRVQSRGLVENAHRFSYRLRHGEPPAGAVICHTCDNRRCVNPDHLWAGSIADNTADRDGKGRQARGERHRSAKLRESDIEPIRRLSARGERPEEIAEMYAVNQATIRDILAGRTWRHVPS